LIERPLENAASGWLTVAAWDAARNVFHGKTLLNVASARLTVAAGAQKPECTILYTRISSTAGRRQARARGVYQRFWMGV